MKQGEWVLDAGCGSGLLLPFLADQLKAGGRYLGMDILPAGLASLKPRANRLNLNDFVFGSQADFTIDLPLDDASVSCVAAHFSVYTLPEEKYRRQVVKEFKRILKPGGLLVMATPIHSYNAKQIILSSLESLRRQGRPWALKKYAIYPLTLHLGLNYVEKQLKCGRWHGYHPEELREEIEHAGFIIERSETVYSGNGILMVGRKA